MNKHVYKSPPCAFRMQLRSTQIENHKYDLANLHKAVLSNFDTAV